jgi:glycosyltransferase involved in cell wall biosynthesis
MKRVSIISTMNGAAWGGSEALWARVATELYCQGHEVRCSVYARSKGHPRIRQLQTRGISITFRSNVRGFSSSEKILASATQRWRARAALSSFIRAFDPDHVLVSLGTFQEVLLTPHVSFLRDLKTPYHLLFHNNLESSTYPVDAMNAAQTLLERSAGNWFVSQRLATQVSRQIAVDIPKLQLVANPPNIDDATPLPWGFSNDGTVRAAFIGGLIPSKGLPLLLQVLSQPEWRRRPLRVSVYGEGPELPALRHTVNNFELHDVVDFRGFTNDIRKVWQEHQALLLPSFHEGMPIVIHEAMLLHRVCVVTDVGGAAEVIADGQNGFLAHSAAFHHFADAMERWWQRRKDWERIARAAGESVRQWREKYPLSSLVRQLTI